MIPDGQPGAGQHFLPLENNGKAVDLDLINNIMREPYADRFRLILNDLGAGLAARGKTLDAIIKRADPALRQTDRVLADARRPEPARSPGSPTNSDTDPRAARPRAPAHRRVHQQREHRRPGDRRAKRQDLEAGLPEVPRRAARAAPDDGQAARFSDQATPVFSEFRAGAPAIARATEALGPFANAATPSLITLGDRGPARASSRSSTPTRSFARSRSSPRRPAPARRASPALLASLRKTGGYK